MLIEIWSMEFLTLLAIFAGPIAAVLITRFIDHRRERHSRKMEILRKLMRSRRARLSIDHVESLNLIEVEFYGNANVLAEYKPYIQHFSNDDMNPDKWSAVSDDLFTKLVHAVGRSVGYNIEQLDIFRGGYVPRGWEMAEQEHQLFRRLMIELLKGERSIPITNMYHFGADQTFPPPPAQKGQ